MVVCRLHVLVMLLHNVEVNVCWVGLGWVPECCVKLNPKNLPVFLLSCGLCIWSLVNKRSSSCALREDSSSTFTPELLF